MGAGFKNSREDRITCGRYAPLVILMDLRRIANLAV